MKKRFWASGTVKRAFLIKRIARRERRNNAKQLFD
jgi:hypothetical protein